MMRVASGHWSQCTLSESNFHGNALGHADFEILPAHPQAVGPDLVFKGVHAPRRRSANSGARVIKQSLVTRTFELGLDRIQVDRASEMRADRRQDGDVFWVITRRFAYVDG